jgi:flagellar assembly protein FliH
MISPSEIRGERSSDSPVMPVRLVSEDRQDVSRLEFYPLGVGTVAEEICADRVTISIEEEVVAVEDQLLSQADEITARIERAQREAKLDARLELQSELEEKMAAGRSTIQKIFQEFSRERKKYFAEVEGEVVKLALAIAARVLHREATLDPMLLGGVVRVALEKVEEGSSVVLRVPQGEVEKWRQAFAVTSGRFPEIVADGELQGGECVMETNVGRVELGVRAQLEEIERGFFDLMHQRPA